MFNSNYGVFSFQKQKFRSSKNAIVVNDDVVMKMITIFNKYPCAKKALSILTATKVMKKLCCVYWFPK